MFTPNKDGQTYRFDFYRANQLTRSHFSKPGPKKLDDFKDSIERTFRPDSYWMQIFCIGIHVGDTTLGVWNRSFFKQRGLKVEKTPLETVGELKAVMESEMKRPTIPVDDILRKMESYSRIKLF